jgi:DNA-binding NarL/FixJ family response regulator
MNEENKEGKKDKTKQGDTNSSPSPHLPISPSNQSNSIKIIIADDHPIVRRGLRQVIESDSRLIVLGEANDGAEAIDLIEELKPEIALLDVDMPTMDGFQAAREIHKRRLAVKIIFLTIHSEEDLFHSAMNLGANGYLLKDNAISEIVNGVKAVSEGKFYISASLTSFLLKRQRASQNFVAETPSINKLTGTERRILQMIADYKSNKEIGEEMFIHFRTVESHRHNISRKLDLRGHNALLKFALKHKNEL